MPQPYQGLEREAIDGAVDAFLQAIALDSTYAPAYAGLSRAYGRLWTLVPGDEAGEVVRLRRTAAERALALDDELPEAIAALAGFLTNEGRFEEAEREYLRALDLSPGNAAVQAAYADMLLLSGRQDESIREARHAVALDPLSLESRRILIAALYFASRHEEVLEEGEKILEIDPNDSDALGWMQGAYSALGRHEEAIAIAQRLVDLQPEDYWSFTTLAYAYAESGDREATLHALGAAQELGVPLKESAIVFGMLGDLDTAYEYLERALVEEPEHLFFMEADPSTAPLQADPRWDEWWARVERLE